MHLRTSRNVEELTGQHSPHPSHSFHHHILKKVALLQQDGLSITRRPSTSCFIPPAFRDPKQAARQDRHEWCSALLVNRVGGTEARGRQRPPEASETKGRNSATNSGTHIHSCQITSVQVSFNPLEVCVPSEVTFAWLVHHASWT